MYMRGSHVITKLKQAAFRKTAMRENTGENVPVKSYFRPFDELVVAAYCRADHGHGVGHQTAR